MVPASLSVRVSCPPQPLSPEAGASLSVDIWSVGCIMAEMITGKTLFKGSDRILQPGERVARWRRHWGGAVGAGGVAMREQGQGQR